MGRKKLKRILLGENLKIIKKINDKVKGKWQKKIFKNLKPIIVELGCGKGSFTLEMAKNFPKKNFIGIDRKMDRLYSAAQKAIFNKQKNLAFLNIPIHLIEDYFNKKEIKEIWLTFPDPHPKNRHEKRRLTSANNLKIFLNLLAPKGKIYLKTDDEKFFKYSILEAQKNKLKTSSIISDIHGKNTVISPSRKKYLKILTDFEKKWISKNKKIFFAEFKIN